MTSTTTARLQQSLSELKAICDQSNPNAQQALERFTAFHAIVIRISHRLQKESDFKLAMEGLEIGANLSMELRDIERFERVFCQLKQFYNHQQLVSVSANRSSLLGLYLMWLLAENRLGHFHIELELLTDEDLQNPFIKFPMDIEQFMMEGSYNKILQLRQNLPSKYYELFLNRLEKTVRNEIAFSLETVHSSVPVQDALKLLNFATIDHLQHYVKENSDERPWTIEQNAVVFAPRKRKEQTIDAMTTAQQMLQFAKNIDAIM